MTVDGIEGKMKVYFVGCDRDQSHLIIIGVYSSIKKANQAIKNKEMEYHKEGISLSKSHWETHKCELDKEFA